MEQNKQTNKALSHFGILGMKWGVRRPVGPDGTVKGTAKGQLAKTVRFKEKAADTDDYAKSRELKKKAVKHLTNAEIKAYNERISLEQNFKRLNPNALEKGHAAVKAALAIGTTLTAVHAFYNSPLGQKMKNTLLRKKVSAS